MTELIKKIQQPILQKFLKHDLRGWVLPIIVFLIWWLSTHAHWVNSNIVPAPIKVYEATAQAWHSGDLWIDLRSSLIRDFIGFGLGSFFGITIGTLLALSTWLDRLFSPTLHGVKQLALFAWVPLMSMWLGHGEVPKELFIALAAFYPVLFNTYDGVKNVKKNLFEVTQVFHLTSWQRLTRLILPSASPFIFAGLHVALIYSWLATIGAEYFFIAAPGLAMPLIDGRDQFDMGEVLYGMLMIGLLGALLNVLANKIENFVSHQQKAS